MTIRPHFLQSLLHIVVRTTAVKPKVWTVESWLEDENYVLCSDATGRDLMGINLQSEMVFTNTKLERTPSGKAYIELGGRSCLALAFE